MRAARRAATAASLLPAAAAAAAAGARAPVAVTLRRQHKARTGRYGWRVADDVEEIDPSRAMLVVIDMWDKYWCPSDQQAHAALALGINQTAARARELGILVAHAPSDCLPAYASAAARAWVRQLPNVTVPQLRNVSLPPYPLAVCKDYPATCWPTCDSYYDPTSLPWHPHPWHRESGLIEVLEQDAVVDSNSLQELANVAAARNITHVLYSGVATNMCVMERMWGMIKAWQIGLQPILLRELTDTAYSPYDSPYVSKEEGTALMVGYIEKFLAPSASMYDVTLHWAPPVPPPA